MIFTPTFLQGNFVIDLNVNTDDRGWFGRTFCRDTFEKEIGHTKEWMQMNHSFTTLKGALRGLHYQIAPFSEIKLVRCVAGSVFDVIVDIRKNSPTYLQYFGTELSSVNKRMMYIPEGFAHGFQTLEKNTELIYCHSENYNAGAESGILYNDPILKINWPLSVTEISKRDTEHTFINSDFKAL
jgi:dTDP-4-dehydrorhamnose 3,5-epimerase